MTVRNRQELPLVKTIWKKSGIYCHFPSHCIWTLITRRCRPSSDFLEEQSSVHMVCSDAGSSSDLIGFFSIKSSWLIKKPESQLKTTLLGECQHLLHVRSSLGTNPVSKAVSHSDLKLFGPSAALSPRPRMSALFCTGFNFAYVVWCGFF